MRWYTGDPTGSVVHDPALQSALKHTLFLAVICVAVAVPLGVMLALGLQRWRGRGSGATNTLMLLPLVTPEIVMGVALLLLFLQVFAFIGLGTLGAGDRPGDVRDLLRRRHRPRAPGLDRARIRGGGRRPRRAGLTTACSGCCCRCWRRRSWPSAAVVFALSLDDFVITQYLAAGADTNTVSMLLYSTARGAPTPALNALATITLVITLFTLGLAYLVYRRFAGGGAAQAAAGVEV